MIIKLWWSLSDTNHKIQVVKGEVKGKALAKINQQVITLSYDYCDR